VDLNSLLQNLEVVIQKARSFSKNNQTKFITYKRGDLNTFFWNEKINFYVDYQFENQQKLNRISLGGMFPLCFKNSSKNIQAIHAKKMAKIIKEKLLKPGGLVSVATNTKQQWDAPNGWAPLQWMSIWGLEQNGQKVLAAEIAKRWVSLNNDVYLRTGKLMEKYNVENLQLEAGGGEYPGQDGFGWTNGVLLALINKYELNK
jgi:alpha,alpha-trehalase